VKSLRIVLILSVLFVASGVNNDEVRAADPSLGVAVTFPFFLTTTGVPAGTITATAFIQLLAQGTISQVIDSRLSLRFFLGTTGFVLGLTSMQETLIIFLNRDMAQVYTGGGVGFFPVLLGPVPPGTPALFMSLHTLLGFRLNTDLFSVFTELVFEVAADSTPSPPVIMQSLQVTIGTMVNF